MNLDSLQKPVRSSRTSATGDRYKGRYAIRLKEFWALIKETFSEWSEDKAPRLAAALSYYTIFSLAPLLVIAIGIAGLVFERREARDQVIAQIASLIGEQGANAVETMIEATQQGNAGLIATIVGLVTLLLGAAGVFGQLKDALNTIWEVAPKPGRGVMGLIRERFLSFTMVLGIGFLLLVALVITAAISALGEFASDLFPGSELVMQVVNFAVSFAVIMVLFAMIFKILPDVKIAWRDVWLGAAVTSLLFSIGKWLIGLYLGQSSAASVYGAAGSLVIILLWVYYSAQILFLGAEFTQVYANRYGSRMVPEEGAIALTEAARAQQGIPHRETLERAEPAATRGDRYDRGVAARSFPGEGPTPETELLPPARPSLLAFSAILAVLVGFVSGLVVKRGGGSGGK